jgi:hypothetical protein
VTTALDVAAADDAITQGLVASAAAWLAGVDGDSEAVELHSARATGLLEATDALEIRGLARVGCANAAALVGNSAAATRHRRRAIDAFEAKENIVAAARQRALL